MAEETRTSGPACPFCGRTEYIWGVLTSKDKAEVVFHPDGPFFTLTSPNEPLRVRKCEECGNVQCFSVR